VFTFLGLLGRSLIGPNVISLFVGIDLNSEQFDGHPLSVCVAAQSCNEASLDEALDNGASDVVVVRR
jgi:hypothetical protein